MGSERSIRRVYEELGVKPVINATGGNMTFLGGSILSPKVNDAMREANRYYVDMEELLDRAGRIIAELVGAEAAYVTPGCCAALALGTAACIAGHDPEKIERLPDTAGMKCEVIIQRGLRNKYERCMTVPGARLVEVGDASGTTSQQIESAMGPLTAAIHYLAPGGGDGVVPLEEVIQIGKRHGVPVLVDAAAQVYPVEHLRKYTGMGADLVCYGGKYFGGPNSSGILCGRKDLIESATLQGFIGFETGSYRSFGRPLKLDRQEIIAVVVALREWVTMDHSSRFERYDRRIRGLQKELKGVPNFKIAPEPAEGPATRLWIMLDEAALGTTASEMVDALREGDPSIWVDTHANALVVSVSTIMDGDEHVIADRLKCLLAEV